MSQSKTIVPGMEAGKGGNSYKNEDVGDFYSRGTNVSLSPKGTVVPGTSDSDIPSRSGQATLQRQHQSGKPITGFLYSISRQGIGEYWPLHIGQNTIGSSSRCDICLCEGTVSAEHAVLVIRKMKKPGKTIASINDSRSTNGTMVNGESLGFSAVECFNGDIITIGENYELVLFLIDVKALGLNISENFIPLDARPDEPDPNAVSDPYVPGHTQPENMYPPKFDDPESYYENRPTDDGTVGMDGSRSSIKPGGTIGL
jgi:pSer/pThr/pTyr-binding forkhead associated (FHA) protein